MYSKFKFIEKTNAQKSSAFSTSVAKEISALKHKVFLQYLLFTAGVHKGPINWLDGWGAIIFNSDLTPNEIVDRMNAVEIWVRGNLHQLDAATGQVHKIFFNWIDEGQNVFILEAYLDPSAIYVNGPGGGGGGVINPTPPPPPPIG